MICPRCTRPLPEWLLRDSFASSICPNCQSALEVHCFPALYRFSEKLDPAQLTLTEGEASCYEHAGKRAASLCSNCGRFLCALCEVQLGRRTLCPDCLNLEQAKQTQDSSLVNKRTKFDSTALALAIWPAFTIYFTFISAPLALIMAIYAWNKPTSIVRRGRWRIFMALGISSLEIAAMVGLIVAVVSQIKGKT